MSEKFCPIPVRGCLFVCQEEQCEWWVNSVSVLHGCAAVVIARLLDMDYLQKLGDKS